MRREYFTDNISIETMAELIDETLKLEKNNQNKKIKLSMLKIVPAVAAFLLVIGLANFVGLDSVGNDGNITTPGASPDDIYGVYHDDGEEAYEAYIDESVQTEDNTRLIPGEDRIHIHMNTEFTDELSDEQVAAVQAQIVLILERIQAEISSWKDWKNNEIIWTCPSTGEEYRAFIATGDVILLENRFGDVEIIRNFDSTARQRESYCGIDIADTLNGPFGSLEEALGGRILAENPEFIDGGAGFETELPENLFDGNPDTKYCAFVAIHGPFWAEWRYGEAFIADRFLLATANDSEFWQCRRPGEWTLYGSNDGSDWTVILTGGSDAVGHYDSMWFYVDIPGNTDAYSHYRFFSEFGCDYDLLGIIQLSELALAFTQSGS
ncbi:MAG: hypothetical protein LBU83_05445 [Bacteroidales bacterium]|jgi:hypothetical protein|nr:hypothetical protein [Bacteroidales bacterium]